MSLTTSLKSHWKLGESSGTRRDSIGARHLTDNATVTSTTGKVGTAGQFTNANAEYLSRASDADLNMGDVDFTFALWVYLDSNSANRELIIKWDNSTDKQYRLQYFQTSDRFRWLVSPDGSANTNVEADSLGSPSTATWYFIVVWHDAANNEIGIQVNNGTADTAAHSTGIHSATTEFRIGGDVVGTTSKEWDGRIDEVSFWHKVLSSQEKTDLYNSGSGLEFTADTFCGIGGVSDSAAKYRVKTEIAATVQIEYSTSSDLTGSTTSTGVTTASGDDFTDGEEITGLSANTTYYYTPVVNGERHFPSSFPTFKTMPTAGNDAALTIAFSSCQTDPDEATIFGSINGESPNLFMHLGDFGYPDSTVLATQRSNYRTQLKHDGDYAEQLARAMAVERVWDDHDYGPNNSHGDTSGKANSLQAWKEYTAYHDLENASNGIWRSFTAANVEVFVLDTRYQREGTQARFPSSSTNTADTGSTGTSLVLRSADSPSASDDFYNGWYVLVEGVYRRVTDYVGSTRTCTLSESVTGLDSSSTYALKRASILDQDNLGATGQVAWLIAGVNGSARRWKVIASSIAWNATVQGPGGAEDSWGDWDSEEFERNYLLQEITADDVIVISADRHWAGIDDGTNSDWPEIAASPLNQTDRTAEGTWSQGTDATGHKYGLLTFATSPHQVTLTVRDADGTTTAGVTALVVAAAAGGGATVNVEVIGHYYRHLLAGSPSVY